MSSPDPLNDATELIPASSARRVTRSQRSQRFASVTSSPRKQMFELQVGDTRSPQKLWVTVETDGVASAGAARGPRRKLFQSPAPSSTPGTRRRAKAVTTTVPLRDSIEEEPAMGDALATPKRRGRPRKSNGTPMPSAAKRRATTPSDTRTPRRRKTTKTDELVESQSRGNVQPTPKSARRGRPPKDRSDTNEQIDTESTVEPRATSPATTATSGRRSPIVQDLIQFELPAADTLPEPRSDSPIPSEDRVDLIGAPERGSSGSPAAEPAHLNDDADSDIWMATLSDQATPRAPSPLPAAQAAPSPTPSRPAPEAQQPEPNNLYQDNGDSQAGDYVDLVPAASDVSSLDDPVDSLTRRGDDTIAQGEDFSMIFMDSIPSLQGMFNSSIPPVPREELGEETSIIINNTLQSLRQSALRHVEPDNALSNHHAPEASVPAENATVEDAMPFDEPTPRQAPAIQYSSRRESPRRSRSPRKPAGSSPLRRRVLKLASMRAEDSGSAAPERDDSMLDAVHASQRLTSADNDASHIYDDSFSQIPQQILSAATPGPPRASIPLEDNQDEAAPLELDEPFPNEDDARNHHESPQSQPAVTSNASTMSKSEAGRLPTPDDTPPQAEYVELQEQDDSEADSFASPEPSFPESQGFEKGGAVPENMDEESDVPNDATSRNSSPKKPQAQNPEPEILQPEQRVSENLSSEGGLETREGTESESSLLNHEPKQVNPAETAAFSTHSTDKPEARQSPSPVNQDQQVPQELLQDKTARPTLNAIVRAGKVLQSITSDPPSPDARDRQLGSPFRGSGSRDSWNGSKDSQGSKRVSRSPQPPFVFPERRATSRSPSRDDPFGPASQNNGQVQFLQALGRKAMVEPAQPFLRPSSGNSMRHSPSSDGAMSWVAREGPISPRLRGDNTLQEAARLSSTGSGKASLSLGRRDDDADELGQDATEVQDDETDIWEFEARRETPQPARAPVSGRRDALPDNNHDIVPPAVAEQRHGGMEVSGIAAEAANERIISPRKEEFTTATQASEIDEYSQLAQVRQQQAMAKEAESASKAKRFDLSSFFSSPAAIPGMLAQKFLPSKASAMFGASSNRPEPPQAAAPVLPTSSMFPSLPQARFPSSDGRPGSTPSSGAALTAGASSSEVGKSLATQSSPCPATPERRSSTGPRKEDVTPQQKQTEPLLSQPPSQRVLIAATPPRMQLSHADIYKWQQETSFASDSAPPPGFARPLLRPLPPKNASPTKSSLRSPLKPRTPGRGLRAPVADGLDAPALAAPRRDAPAPPARALCDGVRALRGAVPRQDGQEPGRSDAAPALAPRLRRRLPRRGRRLGRGRARQAALCAHSGRGEAQARHDGAAGSSHVPLMMR
ncbi:hypothetical protein HIM_05537 [Hirsutella minnesotensis 3608]|uniref:Uncharacterized protein n=1 Tax=Hirsutella minnesotensis 3608 TaxID=1043627 RepID=A0A0F7ZK85_9HYPO|nr:hypothetical protein HIM_05537 [Hirsutella minnesotensis 3608]